MGQLPFTVFTAVYNSRKLIHRVWESLKAQTFRDFEWVVVDDGSADGSYELVEQFAREASFPVRVARKENGGKHTAWNVGVGMARGELFVTLDHDDACVPTALERFRYWWHTIPEAERAGYSGVNVLCTNPVDGRTIGNPYPASPMVSNNLELAYVHRIWGEKWGTMRTDVLREFPYPEDPALRRDYISENYLWFQIARRYKVLCVNEPLRQFYRDSASSITTWQLKGSLADRLRRHRATRYFYENYHLNENLDYLLKSKKELAKTAMEVWVSGLATGLPVSRILQDATGLGPRVLRCAAFPFGLAAYLYIRAASSK